MKATGVVRHIDELGRIVIPKEIRKTLRIHEGESLEVFIDNNDNIILRKHSALHKIGDFAQVFADAIYTFSKHNVIITDNDTVVSMSGSDKKNYINKPISEELERSIQRRETILEKYTKTFKIISEKEENGSYAICPIVASGDVVGLVMIFSNTEKISDDDMKLTQITSQFLAKHLEQ
jgi:AbrB family transcriptional regulator (stage V sporulation protein T)